MKSFSDLIKEGKERLNELEKEVNETTEKALKELEELKIKKIILLIVKLNSHEFFFSPSKD